MRRSRFLSAAIAVALTATAAYALTVASRTAQVNGQSVGEVVVNDRAPIRIHFSAGGLSPSERAAVVAHRLSEVKDLAASDITAGRLGGKWTVLARDSVLVTADQAEALANRTTQQELALTWRDQLRAAISGEAAPPVPTGAGPAPPVTTAQKVVPILSVGSGLRVGAALVAGSSGQVAKVKAVAQVEAVFGNKARIRALVPVETEDVLRSIRRVPGTAVIAVADIKL